MNFILTSKIYRQYYGEFIILLGTWLRISELCGLTSADVDFEIGILRVDHQLQNHHKFGFHIEKPKTKSGIREIPMSESVIYTFQRVIERRPKTTINEIDGYCDFIVINSAGNPKTANNYRQLFKRIVQEYNKSNRIPIPSIMMPHTIFYTKLATAGTNP